ncbi:MAG: hypothetical protein M3461_15280 [Pseudomonadota bacterium]|nr:hypothetical protein [Pseudomonadota bacterium]
MDVFLLHVQAHFIPGRNLTWYLIFLLILAAYLKVVASLPHSHQLPALVAQLHRHVQHALCCVIVAL